MARYCPFLSLSLSRSLALSLSRSLSLGVQRLFARRRSLLMRCRAASLTPLATRPRHALKWLKVRRWWSLSLSLSRSRSRSVFLSFSFSLSLSLSLSLARTLPNTRDSLSLSLSLSISLSLACSLANMRNYLCLSLSRATLSIHISLSFVLARTVIINTRDSLFHTHSLLSIRLSFFRSFVIDPSLLSRSFVLINYYLRM